MRKLLILLGLAASLLAQTVSDTVSISGSLFNGTVTIDQNGTIKSLVSVSSGVLVVTLPVGTYRARYTNSSGVLVRTGTWVLSTSGTFTLADIETIVSGGGGSGGSVISVGLGMPAQFTVANSPVTSTGTLTASWINQAANLVLAGPTTGAAAVPTFRALVAADIPTLDAAKVGTGEFDAARIPTLDAAKVGTGTFADARIPSLDAAKTTTGTFAIARIPTTGTSPTAVATTAGALTPSRAAVIDANGRIAAATGTLTDCVYVNGTSGSCGGGGAGEANTSSNAGAGIQLAKAKSGVDLPFRTLTSTDATLTLTQNTDTVDFTAGPSLVNAGAVNDMTASNSVNVLYTSISRANDASTGTTTNKLVSLTGATSAAVVTPTSATSGIIGVCVSGCGTTGNARVITHGYASCVFDGATTAGNWVQRSGTTAGNCVDAGSSYPSSGQVLGRVLSTNGAGGTHQMLFQPFVVPSAAGALLAANNLSDVASASTARTNLGLGGAATLNVGTTAGTVAAGDHTHAGGSAATIFRYQLGCQGSVASGNISQEGGSAGCRSIGTSGLRTGVVFLRDISDTDTFQIFAELPSGFTGTATLVLRYNWNGTVSGNARLSLETGCRATDEAMNSTFFNAAQTITVTPPSATNRLSSTTTSLTTTGCAAGETMFIKGTRPAVADAADTYNDWLEIWSAVLTLE
jgi:hypothetical protein